MATFSVVFACVNSTTLACLYVVLLFFAFRRNLYQRLFFFTAYVILLVARDAAGLWVIHTSFYNLAAGLYIYWGSEFILTTLRLLTIAEISKRYLRGYPVVWAFALRLLTAVAVILLSWTAYSASQNVHHFRRFILVGDQRFEFMQAILLLLLFIIGIYYGLQISPLYRLILIGIGIYSSIQVADNQIGILHKMPPNSVFDYIRRGSFTVSLALWTYAVWRWAAVQDAKPKLISQATYDRLSPQLHDRLRELNDKLADLTG